ncbi:hypothetical protein FSARC_11407 [Fusarium sarcochroum]|uniref:Heterokaryon incompatibility domain-containing protein n=1 Tax=Fusarium sarcochroum TaxID=1208366 RepID=A0A8H4X140_9HYPO|nr:hypothetical protein FSARC_11407 [Fusarium sarcochroum]
MSQHKLLRFLRHCSPSPMASLTKRTNVYAVHDVPLECDVYEASDYPPTSPVFLFFHSGGLVNGSRVDVHPWIAQLCKKNQWPLISADYRFLPQIGASEIVEDAKAAYAFARNLGGHKRQVILTGASAGFFLCCNLVGRANPTPLALFSITGLPTFQHTLFTSSRIIPGDGTVLGHEDFERLKRAPICSSNVPRQTFTADMLLPSGAKNPDFDPSLQPRLDPSQIEPHRESLYEYLVLNNLFKSFVENVDEGFNWAKDPVNAEKLAEWPTTIFVQGDADDAVDVDVCRSVADALGKKAKFFLAKGRVCTTRGRSYYSNRNQAPVSAAGNEQRSIKAVQDLDRLWNGRGWIPPWPKNQDDSEDRRLQSQNNLADAAANGVGFPSLWQPGGQAASNPEQSVAVLASAIPSPYEPLSQHTDSTRLVRIEAAKTDDDPIVCKLFEVEFRVKPKFHAFSYRWGDGPPQCNITLNGAAFSIRQNLADALQYLRKHAANTPYWIDAICINQDDVLERNRQVRMMHHIYFRAETVVVWLGKRYAGYESSVPDLHALGYCQVPSGQVNLESTTDKSEGDSSTKQRSSEDVHQHKLAEDLYHDGYWSRLWIIQEIGLAHNIKVCFGNYAVEWKSFIHFIAMHNVGSDGPIKLNRQRQGKYTESSSLLQLLQDHREALCQDKKDKVYGLIGLASDAGGFIIDYQKSTFEIWTDVMEFMNRHDLFADKDIVYVGGLVKYSLMGSNCLPLQQILRQYAPGKEDSTILTDPNHFKAFELQAAMVGCVICVGPRPHEIVGSLNQADRWTEQVQSNYKDDLGRAHQESDALIRTILDLDDDLLSKKCFDCRSVIQWTVHRQDYSGHNEALHNNWHWIPDIQSRSHGLSHDEKLSAEKSPSDSSRLFQMLDRYKGQTLCKMGLASSNVCSGDLIFWLGWPRRAVIVRSQGHDSESCKLKVVGTAVVTEDLNESRLGCLQLAGRLEYKSKQTLYLDATTIFILLE